jgi:hypothetical protein
MTPTTTIESRGLYENAFLDNRAPMARYLLSLQIPNTSSGEAWPSSDRQLDKPLVCEYFAYEATAPWSLIG